VLFNEPKLLKSLQSDAAPTARVCVSVLFNEPKLLKTRHNTRFFFIYRVSVLFNEPKLLKTTRPRLVERGELFQCSSTSRNC